MKNHKKCLEVNKKFQNYQNDSLSLSETYKINEHLKACNNCRNELETILLVERTKLLLEDKQYNDYDLSDLVSEYILKKEKFVNRKLRHRMGIAFLFAILLLILSLLLFTHTFDFLGINMRIM